MLCTGQDPAWLRGRNSQRMPADSSAVITISTRLAGSASAKNFINRRMKACRSLMRPASTSGRTEISSMSSTSINMKAGNTGRKNAVPTTSEPIMKHTVSNDRRRRVTDGRGGRDAGSSRPMSWAGEPAQIRPAGTRSPLRNAVWPRRCAPSATATSPSSTLNEPMAHSRPMSMRPRCSMPPRTQAFSRLTALPMLAPSPIVSRSGTRKVIEPTFTSSPICAPSARSQPT